HIPKAKATAIADTPELKRIAENTKIQSNVQYHADFEKQKGKLTQVADDPETLRIKQNTKHISNVEYHGDLAKKAAMEKQREVTEVADNRAAESLSQYQQPSTPSPTQPLPQVSQHNHSQLPSPNQPQSTPVLVPNHSQLYASQNSNLHKQQANQQKYQQQPPPPQQQQQSYQAQHNNHPNHPNNYQSQNYVQQNNIRSTVLQSAHNPSGSVSAPQQNNQPKYYDQYDNYARPNAQNIQYQPQQPQQQHNNNNANAVYHNNHYNAVDGRNTQYQQHPQHHLQQQQHHQQQNRGAGYNNSHYNQMALSYSAADMGGIGGIGKISDYDPLTDGPRNVPNATRPTSTLIFSSDRGMVNNPQNRRIGSINDIDPANGIYGSIEQNNYQQQQNQTRQSQQYGGHHQQQQQQQPPPQKSKMRAFRAIYDYEAQDSDEVSFSEGDIIFEVESIDAGWMTGRVERSGKTGMLPANYVEPALI
ncbi:LIM and SH3 domain protein Lasp, partial [Pseudolycoriella hygida]